MNPEMNLKGLRFGRCERWVLENAPEPGQEPRYINQEYDPRTYNRHTHRIVIRAIGKLKGLGLVETHRWLFDPEIEDPDGIYSNDGHCCVNHRFWANYVRLTPLGVKVKSQLNI